MMSATKAPKMQIADCDTWLTYLVTLVAGELLRLAIRKVRLHRLDSEAMRFLWSIKYSRHFGVGDSFCSSVKTGQVDTFS